MLAIGDGFPIPHVVVDFTEKGLDGIARITSLDAPHRVYDAILRDGLLGGEKFMDSPVGQRLRKAKAEGASVLLEISPTALLFGAWHSTGEGGGLGAEFARCLISEIVAINAPVEDVVVNRKTGEIDIQTSGRRTDPLAVLNLKAKRSDVKMGLTVGTSLRRARTRVRRRSRYPRSIAAIYHAFCSAARRHVRPFGAQLRLELRSTAGCVSAAVTGTKRGAACSPRWGLLRSWSRTIVATRCVRAVTLSVMDVRPSRSCIQTAHRVDRTRSQNASSLYEEAFDAARRAGFAFA